MSPSNNNRLFRFPMQARVRWAGDPAQPCRITQRQWTERDIMSPLVRYLLCRPTDPDWPAAWAYEADCVAWEGDT